MTSGKFAQYFVFLMTLLAPIALRSDPPGTLLPEDGVQWEFDEAGVPIEVVGDIHGDFSALYRILRARGLVSAEGRWVGGNRILVLLGDLNDRGNESRFVFDWVRRLEAEAQREGGRVHTLLGNHDIWPLFGKFSMTQDADARHFRGFRRHRGMQEEPWMFAAAANLPDERDYWSAVVTEYRDWLLSRQVVIRIGRSLFVHAGLSEWLDRPEYAAQVNATARAWIRFLAAPSLVAENCPPEDSLWVLTDGPGDRNHSPLVTRDLIEGPEGVLPLERLQTMMTGLGVDRIFIGHSYTPDVERRLYDGRVINLDTGNSSAYRRGGRQSSAEILPGSDSIEIRYQNRISSSRSDQGDRDAIAALKMELKAAWCPKALKRARSS